MPAQVSQSDIDEAVRLYKAGWSMKQIGSMRYMSAGAVRYRLVKAGVPLRPKGGVLHSSVPKRLPPDEIDKTVQLYNKGFSTIEIGHMLGIAHSTVGWRLRKAGVPLRSRHVSAAIHFRERGRRGGLPDRAEDGKFIAT